MIDPVSPQYNPGAMLGLHSASDELRTAGLRIDEGLKNIAAPDAGGARTGGKSFSDLVGKLVQEVDGKGKVAEAETRRLMLGESNSIHSSMIAMQESGLAFTLLVEVRNKVVQAYQELMRMPV